MKKSLLRTATLFPKPTHNYIRGGVLTCVTFLAAALFSSCDSFLKAQDIGKQIKKQIEYNNTEPYAIYVDAQKDTGIITKPAGGEADVKPTDTFNLSFNCDTSYQFIKWQVYDAATGEDIEDNTYLKIEDPQQLDTTCTFLKIPENQDIELSLRAVTAKRPKIFLGKPTSLEPGSFPTTSIQVLFDQYNMDPDCIYYTEEEMQELKDELHLKDSDFLQGDEENCNSRYYGYRKNGKHVFKNIQLIDYDNPANDMAWYYCAPYWEKEPNIMGGSTLVIPTSNPPPPFNATIYVSLNNNFCYYQDGISVKLMESKGWPYKICYQKDNSVPTIIYSKLANNAINYNIIKYKNDQNEFEELPYYSNTTEPVSGGSNALGLLSTGTYVSCPRILNKDSITLSISIRATDKGGNGISNKFRLRCVHRPDNGQPPIFELPYLHATANEAYSEFSEEYTYILPRTSGLKSAGYYCFTIEVMDNYNDVATFPKYFWIQFVYDASDVYN